MAFDIIGWCWDRIINLTSASLCIGGGWTGDGLVTGDAGLSGV